MWVWLLIGVLLGLDTARAEPERVRVGFHLNDIQEVDLKTHSYSLDFYVWFRWTDPDLDPSTSAEIANPFEQWGHTITPLYEEPQELDDGSLYQVVRIQGPMSRKMPLYNYPFDRQRLTVVFEDALLDDTELVYEVDPGSPTRNPSIELPGYVLGEPTLEVDRHHYATRFGDPRYSEQTQYSRVTYTVPITRPPVAYAAKFFLPVLSVVVCATVMFLLSPKLAEARVDVGITSLLTVVALQITYNDALPDVGYLMLMDKVYLLAYAFVLMGLAVVVYTTRLAEAGEEARAERLHRRALVAVVAAWVASMAALVGAAFVAG